MYSWASFKFCTQGSISEALWRVIFCDLSTGIPRPPVLLHKPLLLQLHGLSHPGVRASRRLISQHFVSKYLSKDVGLWARSCIPCQRSKIQTHTRSSAPHIPIPNRRFSHFQVNEWMNEWINQWLLNYLNPVHIIQPGILHIILLLIPYKVTILTTDRQIDR